MNIKKWANIIGNTREIVQKIVLVSVWLMSLIGMYSTSGTVGGYGIWTCMFCLTTVVIVDRMD